MAEHRIEAVPAEALNQDAPETVNTETAETVNTETETTVETVITVFDDKDSYTAKHALQTPWSLWFDTPAKKSTKDWTANLKLVVTVDSVEDFWGVFNNIPSPSSLPNSANLYFFKAGIEPSWEDAHNAAGGKWVHQSQKAKRDSVLDTLWMHTVLQSIGGGLEDDLDEITGVVVSVRKAQDRISIWTRSAGSDPRSKERLMRIGLLFKKTLAVSDRIGFTAHSDSASKSSRYLSLTQCESGQVLVLTPCGTGSRVDTVREVVVLTI